MKNHSTPPRGYKFIIVSCAAVVFFIAFFVLFFHGKYPQKIINLLSPNKQIEYQSKYSNVAVEAWATCLDQLDVDADVVFFGDSITRRGNFADYFPGKTVCNLGLGTDTIVGMTERSGMLSLVSPEKVFLLGGINSLRDNTFDNSVAEYDMLLATVSESCSAQVFVISVLPISADSSSKNGCHPDTILRFNSSIQVLAEKYGFRYIDLHSFLSDQDGYILPEYTTDGVHLTKNAYDVWIDIINPFI